MEESKAVTYHRFGTFGFAEASSRVTRRKGGAMERRWLWAALAAGVVLAGDGRRSHASCALPVDLHDLAVVAVTVDGVAVPSLAPWQRHRVYLQSYGYEQVVTLVVQREGEASISTSLRVAP